MLAIQEHVVNDIAEMIREASDFAIAGAAGEAKRRQRIGNPRYSRLETCATRRDSKKLVHFFTDLTGCPGANFYFRRPIGCDWVREGFMRSNWAERARGFPGAGGAGKGLLRL